MDELEKNHWWFVAKRTFLRLAIDREVGDVSKKKVLDVGCGTGGVMQMLNELGAECEGVDVSEKALEYCRKKNLKVVQGDGIKLPYADNTFDLVISSDVLEHIEKDFEAVAEVKRVLKPGGVIIATVPAHQRLFSYHDIALHHVRRYSKKQFFDLLSGSFSKTNIAWIHSAILVPAIIQRMVFKIAGKTDSDVKINSRPINIVLGFWYKVETFIYKLFKGLPFGLSLIGVARKDNL